jgi:hypothetical protein
MAECRTCADVGWVCESHPDRPWSEDAPGGCQCDAGIPCPECNPSDAEHPPRLPSDVTVTGDKDGFRH